MRSFSLLLLLILLMSGCGFGNNTISSEKKFKNDQYQVIDDNGSIIKFSEKPQRIYATTLSTEEILTELVPLERIVAISEPAADLKISLNADKAAQIPIKLPQTVSVERIVSLKPDLVLAQENSNLAFIRALKDVGLKVYVSKVPTTVEMVRKKINDLAEAVGEKSKGREIISALDAKIAFVKTVTDRIPKENKKVILAYSLLGAFGSAEGLFHDICLNAGVINGAALAGLVRGEHLSKEKIVEVNPDVLMFTEYSSTQKVDSKAFNNEVLTDPALQSIKAIKNNKVIIIKDRYRYAASQHIADGVLDIAQKTYPEYFK